MVKICPKCREKKFDDKKFCVHCGKFIKGVEKQAEDPVVDDFPEFTPRGYTSDSWI